MPTLGTEDGEGDDRRQRMEMGVTATTLPDNVGIVVIGSLDIAWPKGR